MAIFPGGHHGSLANRDTAMKAPMHDGFSDFFYPAPDGLKLHARVYEPEGAGALPVVCLPGLTRNARDFHLLALSLSGRQANPRKVVTFEYRGRGLSAYDPDWKKYDPVVETGDVIAGLAALGINSAAFIGTSRGGLIILILAVMQPGLLAAAVLNDVGPAVEMAGLVQIKSYLENASPPSSFAEAVATQKSVHGASFAALADSDWERMVRAIYRDENGRPVADFDPQLLNTLAVVDVSKPLPSLWPQFEALAKVPVLAIRGANSKLLSAATLDEMAQRHPGVETLTVEGQGHAPLLETGSLPERIAAFIDRAEEKGSKGVGE
jgi:pimeloyl-ACP methyl ester carboxylesterase